MRRPGLVLAAALASAAFCATALPAAQTAERPRLFGIAYVAFRVSNLAAADTFYGDWLQLERDRAEPCRGFRVGTRQRVLIEAGLKPDEDERLVAVGFVTEDPARLAAYLRSRGTTVTSGTRCGQAVERVTDPEGHVIELVAPPSPRERAAGHAAIAGSRILHAGLTVRDRAAMDRFYVEVLGFSEIWRGGRADEVTDWINMKVPDGTEYLEYMLVGSEALTRERLGSLHHVALLVADMQDAYEAVLGRVPAERRKDVGSPRVGRNRRWQLNLFDPDGTRTELMEAHTMR